MIRGLSKKWKNLQTTIGETADPKLLDMVSTSKRENGFFK
jgi:hypothetical protein